MALYPAPTHGITPIDFRDRWRQALVKTLANSGNALKSTAVQMKRNYDERVRRQREFITTGDYVFLRLERRDEAESRHKIAAVAKGPYKVESVSGHTVVIEYPGAMVERVN